MQELLAECDCAKAGSLATGTSVQARVELVKSNSKTLVLSLPKHGNALAFASFATCNTQHSGLLRAFAPGQLVQCSVARAATGDGSGSATARLLMKLKPQAAPAQQAQGKSKGRLAAVGAVQEGTVRAVHALHADVQVGKSTGRLHVCELKDWSIDDIPEVRCSMLVLHSGLAGTTIHCITLYALCLASSCSKLHLTASCGKQADRPAARKDRAWLYRKAA